MRVVLIHYRDSASLGGSLRVGELLGKHLGRFGTEPHFLFAYGGPGPVASSSGVPCHFLCAEGPADPQGWRNARRILRQVDPEILHFINPVFWLSLALLDWRPKVLHVHGPMEPGRTRLRDRVIWRSFRYLMSGYVCVSQNMRQKMLAAGWSREENAWVVYNAVDCQALARVPARDEARRLLGLPEAVRVLGFVARQVPEKGCFDALELLAQLPSRFHLAYFGDGPLHQDLRRRAEGNGALFQRVHFRNTQDDVRPVYGAIDYLLFLSKTEPFGLTIAEAMACGVPVVGLAGEGGYREPEFPLVTEETSVLSPRPDHEAAWGETPAGLLSELAERIVRLDEDSGRRGEMSYKARSHVREFFDAPRQVREMVKVYHAVCQRQRRGG